MALEQKFYKEIFEKEELWINMLKSNLINIYFLPELKEFYEDKQRRFDYEFQTTGNNIMQQFSYAINSIIIKIDYFIEEDKKGNYVNIADLRDLFFTNIFYNDIIKVPKQKLPSNKKDLYELRNKVINDEIDDDFYYEERGKAI